PSTIVRHEVSSRARYSSSFPGKCWYSTGLETPARSAISSIDALWYPSWPKTSSAPSNSCARRASRGRRPERERTGVSVTDSAYGLMRQRQTAIPSVRRYHSINPSHQPVPSIRPHQPVRGTDAHNGPVLIGSAGEQWRYGVG